MISTMLAKKILASLDIFDSNEFLNGIMLFTQKYLCGKKIELEQYSNRYNFQFSLGAMTFF